MGRRLVMMLMLTCIASTADAQVASTADGFFLGARLTGTTLKVEDVDRENGGGLALDLGYGFRNGVAIFVNADAATMSAETAESFNFGHFELGARYTFAGNEAKLRPFVDASVGLAMAWQDDVLLWDDPQAARVDVEMTGPVYGLGSGIGYYLRPSLALTGGVRVGFGKFTSVKVDNITIDLDDEDQSSFTSMRVNFGLAWYPAGRSTATALRR